MTAADADAKLCPREPTRLEIAAWEFVNDWRKGDFELGTLASLDAQAIEAALNEYRAAPPAAPPAAAAPATPKGKHAQWRIGNEYAPYHPYASHVSPDYRDGWNECYAAAQAQIEAQARELAELRIALAKVQR